MPILEMKVPSPGESISEVEIAAWLVSDGDYVFKDQAIAEVDSDKATLELPAEMAGTITLKAEEGDAVAVGAVVCLIDTDAEAPADAAPPAAASARAHSAAMLRPALPLIFYCRPTSAPRGRRVHNQGAPATPSMGPRLSRTQVGHHGATS